MNQFTSFLGLHKITENLNSSFSFDWDNLEFCRCSSVIYNEDNIVSKQMYILVLDHIDIEKHWYGKNVFKELKKC